jgi:hypothetical protein
MPSSTLCELNKSTPTPSHLLPILQKRFPGYFPENFIWRCECNTAGFPGCNKLRCFCIRICLAITHHHQAAESTATRKQVTYIYQRTEEALVAPDHFNAARKEQYEADLADAVQLLKKYGVDASTF